ncbi:transcription antitermination factor NusB [bacterium]|jgi:N utilization substance protein B|nr:transcription antitermination factor NusB [bacterium]
MTDSVMRVARIIVIEALYESETSGHSAPEAFERRLSAAIESDPRMTGREGPVEFGRAAIRGIEDCHSAIDAYIADAAPRYPIATLAVVDRNILRLAIWELLTEESAAAAVVNEAVEMARRYGGESSPRFVNGVLRTISQRIERERATPGEAEPQTHPPSHEE